MSRLLILGASGSLGSTCASSGGRRGPRGHGVRPHPSKLPPRSKSGCPSIQAISRAVPLDLRGQDALINCAGHVADGETFVGLVDRLVTSVDSLPPGAAGLLVAGGRGAARHRLVRSPRRRAAEGEVHLLAPPGQLRAIEPVAPGLETALSRADGRRARDRNGPAAHLTGHSAREVPAFARALPGPLLLPVFASLIPQMIVTYADAAAVMLANLGRGNAMSRHRVGLALPRGKKGRKSHWSAKVNPDTT